MPTLFGGFGRGSFYGVGAPLSKAGHLRRATIALTASARQFVSDCAIRRRIAFGRIARHYKRRVGQVRGCRDRIDRFVRAPAARCQEQAQRANRELAVHWSLSFRSSFDSSFRERC